MTRTVIGFLIALGLALSACDDDDLPVDMTAVDMAAPPGDGATGD